jgi:hypothetical protein
LLKIRKKDLDTSGQRVKIRIEATDTKTRAGRSVWLTKEAAKYLMIRIRSLKDDDLIWTRNENTDNAEIVEGQVFSRYVDKVGLGKRYKSNNNRMITLYSFRSFFFGLASDIHREGYAHLMTGHDGYLQQYDRMSDAKKLEWFLKLEPELIIDETERQKQELEKNKTRITELEDKTRQITDLEGQMKRLQTQVSSLTLEKKTAEKEQLGWHLKRLNMIDDVDAKNDRVKTLGRLEELVREIESIRKSLEKK